MRPHATPCLLTCLTLAVTACTDVPDFDTAAQLSASRAYPTIEPLGAVVALGGDQAIADSAALQARADALRARAATDRPEPVDPLLLQKAKGLSAQP